VLGITGMISLSLQLVTRCWCIDNTRMLSNLALGGQKVDDLLTAMQRQIIVEVRPFFCFCLSSSVIFLSSLFFFVKMMIPHPSSAYSSFMIPPILSSSSLLLLFSLFVCRRWTRCPPSPRTKKIHLLPPLLCPSSSAPRSSCQESYASRPVVSRRSCVSRSTPRLPSNFLQRLSIRALRWRTR